MEHLHNDLGMEVWATKLPGEELGDIPAKVRELDVLGKEAIVDLLSNQDRIIFSILQRKAQ